MKLIQVEARAKKMVVVHQCVLHASRRERRRNLRLPHAFREPGAGWTNSDMLFYVVGKALDLLNTIRQRNRDQDGLIESAAHDFRLPAFHEGPEPFEIIRVRATDPRKQR